MSSKKQDILDCARDRLKAAVAGMGGEPYRAKQVSLWIYKKGATAFDVMSNLPPALREKLSAKFYIGRPRALKKNSSDIDGTIKYLFGLRSSNTVETAYIPEKGRATVCVSSQVGCKYGCGFCASAQSGFVRDLSASEMLSQVLYLRFDEKLPVTNIVFMGIGEPFDNYENVICCIRTLNDPDLFGLGARKITVSTCGIIPQIRRFSQEGFQVELSVSLHSADDAARSRIAPVNKIYPLKKLMAACRDYTEKTNRVITFEYVLIRGVNASAKDAQMLCRLLKGMKCKVNLIALNRISPSDLEAPDRKEAGRFLDSLTEKGINTTLRKSRGGDIDAGCGQLRVLAGRDR
ncbi:23S rRNA (adenine(2503)-C(2))-methyltransferase RlmN [Candidatus Omnitrophota bacterium]